jgi:hypothetical protein
MERVPCGKTGNSRIFVVSKHLGPNHRRALRMTAASRSYTAGRGRRFQFRIATLLIVTTWLGLACAGLAMPTPFWAGMLFFVVLLSLLMSLLVLIYRGGGVRAFAVGFLIFGGGYLAFVFVLDRSLRTMDPQAPMPTSRTALWVFRGIHGKNTRPVTMYTGNFGTGMGSADGGGLASSASAASPPAMRVVQVSVYNPEHFVEIVHSALSMLLGLLGGVVAQYLYLTRRDETANDK